MCYNKSSMESLKNKTKKISFRIGLTLGLEIVTLLFVLILFISGTMRKSLRDEYVNSAMALVRSGVKIMNQRNSRSTQQLRLYTLSDLALSNEFSTENCAIRIFRGSFMLTSKREWRIRTKATFSA